MKKTPISFLKRCRLCGRCRQGSLDIFSRKDRNLKELIKQCLHINVSEDDSLPKKLCQFCEKKLSLWEKFKNSCDEVQVKLITDSHHNEFGFPRKREGERLSNRIENTSHVPKKDLACDKTIENVRAYRKRKSKACISKSINISFPLENMHSFKDIDVKLQSSKAVDGIIKPCCRFSNQTDLALESTLSDEIVKRNQTDVSSVNLNSMTSSKSKGKCYVADEGLETKASIAKSSQFTVQDMHDLNDTLSKKIISDKNFCAQINDSENKEGNVAVEDQPSPVISETKCSKSQSTRKMQIGRKSNKAEELKSSMESLVKELQCPLCPQKLSTTYNLRHHLDTHSEKCNYCCHLCGKLFRTRSSLSNHVRVHLFDDAENVAEANNGLSGTSSFARAFQCDICDKKFRQSGHLSYHLKMHTGVRSHSCSMCGKHFAEKYQLRRHENAVHNKIKRYTCDICGKQFLHTHNFKAHKLQHEGIAKISCDLCGKTFVTNNAFNRHQRLHTGVKPFACDICGKRFGDCSNRKRHRDKHTDEEKQGLLMESSCKSAPVEEIIEVTDKEREWDSRVKKTYMNLKTYFESNDDVSMKEDGMLNDVGNHELIQSMSNDSSNPLLDCGLFGEDSDGLVGDGRIGMIGGSHTLKDQLVWVPSCTLLPSRDECFNNICADEDDLHSGDVTLGGGVGLCEMQATDITGILEVGMGLCSDFDVGAGIDLDSGKDGLSSDFTSIGNMKDEKTFDLHLQVF